MARCPCGCISSTASIRYRPDCAELIKELVNSPSIIPHGDISEFLDRVWTQIPSSDLYGQDEFLERMQPIFVPRPPTTPSSS
jgi:hypothetical protein